MTTLEFALQMEKDGEHFYRNLAKKSRRPAIKKILDNLAEMEAQHYEVLLALKSSSEIKWENTFRDGIKSIFATLDERTNGFDVDVGARALQRGARSRRAKSRVLSRQGKAGEEFDREKIFAAIGQRRE